MPTFLNQEMLWKSQFSLIIWISIALALYTDDTVNAKKFEEQHLKEEAQCSWTNWSPCTVTCVSRGRNKAYAQQWQQYICQKSEFFVNHSFNATARFQSCADMIPLCISDEGLSAAFQNYFFLAIFISGILLIMLPNMILGFHYTRVWIFKSRKFGQKSEKSVPTFKEPNNDCNFLSNRK